MDLPFVSLTEWGVKGQDSSWIFVLIRHQLAYCLVEDLLGRNGYLTAKAHVDAVNFEESPFLCIISCVCLRVQGKFGQINC